MTATDLTAIEARLATDRDDFAGGYTDQTIRDRDALLGIIEKQQAEIKRYAEKDADAFMKLQVTKSQAKLRATIREQQARIDAVLNLANMRGRCGWQISADEIRAAVRES